MADVTPDVRALANVNSPTDSLTGNVSAAAERLFDDQRKTFKLPPVYPNNPAEQARFEDDFWKVWNHKIWDIETPPPEATNKEQYELDRTFRLAYRDQIKDIFPDLFKRIDLRTAADGRECWRRRARAREVRAAERPTTPRSRLRALLDWPDAGKLIKRFRNWNDIPTTTGNHRRAGGPLGL